MMRFFAWCNTVMKMSLQVECDGRTDASGMARARGARFGGCNTDRDGQPYESEFFRKDGTRVPVLIGATLFQEGGNDGVAFALDLSKQKQAEAEIRALKDQLYRENLALRDEVDRAQMFEEIVGSSKPLKTVLSRIAKVAPTDSTVFITGETGTGKELIARAVHKRSQRAGRAFVSVNCAASGAYADLIGVVWSRERSLHWSYTAAARPL